MALTQIHIGQPAVQIRNVRRKKKKKVSDINKSSSLRIQGPHLPFSYFLTPSLLPSYTPLYMPSLHHKDDVTVQLKVDPYFTGIMRGLANDEAEGCELNGECIVQVHHRPVKARRIVVWFEGRSKVNLQGALGVASSETVESRSLIFKDKHFIGDDGQVKVLEPGTYVYPFSFELPATLPASFRGKYGRIRYRLQATFHRPQMFSSDIHTSTDIVLRRSLPLMHMDNEEVRTGSNQDVHFTASAPAIAYREGGLVRLNLNINLEHPEYQSVRSVTCALREVVKYRTTGERSMTCQSAA